MNSTNEEIIDLVNEKDEVIGQIARAAFNHDVYEQGYVRASEAFLMSKRGELWIPRRTAAKKQAPNGLDFSVSEHVTSGESYLEAVLRGSREELNMDVTPASLTHIGTIEPTFSLPWFAAIYLHRTDATPDYNRNDFTEAIWILPTDLLQLLDHGEKAKTGLAPAVRFLLAHL